MFFCDKCGLCCMNIGASTIYEKLDRGDGICKFFDEETKLCTIYEKRPLLCNLEETYKIYFKGKMSKNEYDQLNSEACKRLKEKGEFLDVFENAE